MKLLQALLGALAISLTAPAFSKDAEPKCANAGSPSIPFWKAQYTASVHHAQLAYVRDDIFNAVEALRSAENAMYFGCIDEFSKQHAQLRHRIIVAELHEMVGDAVRFIAKSEYWNAIQLLNGVDSYAKKNNAQLPDNYAPLLLTAKTGHVNSIFVNSDDAYRRGLISGENYARRERQDCDMLPVQYQVTVPERCRRYLLKHQ